MSDQWRFLKILDDDIQQISRFIEPSANNLQTHSLELARLLMIATQECDVLLKELCRKFGDQTSKSENEYRTSLTNRLPSISDVAVKVKPSNLSFQPFKEWGSNKTPVWWTANNKVKHERTAHFEKANLGNVLNAISAVVVANLYLIRGRENRAQTGSPLQHFRPKLESCGGEMLSKEKFHVPD